MLLSTNRDQNANLPKKEVADCGILLVSKKIKISPIF